MGAKANAQCSVNLTSSAEGCTPFTVSAQFVNGTGKTVATAGYVWDWGNSATSPGLPTGSVQYTYITAGKYTPSLKVTFTDGTTCSVTLPQVTSYSLPKADFILPTPTIRCFRDNFGLNNFAFTDQSTPGIENNAIVKYEWDFGDGSVSLNQNPNHSFQAPGVFTISLKVTDSKGCVANKSFSSSIRVLKDLVFQIGKTPTTAKPCDSAGYRFNLINDTTGTWLKTVTWDFGDGSPTSTAYSPTHVYKKEGIFTVSLTTVNALGCTKTTTTTVEVIPFKLKITHDDKKCFKNNSYNFKAIPQDAADYWEWNFGDPNSGPNNIAAFSWNADHIFTAPGVYQVRFRMISSICGTKDTCFLIYVKGPAAAMLLPPPPFFPLNNYYPPRPMRRQLFVDMANRRTCDQTPIDYVTLTQSPILTTDTIRSYCNANVLNKVFDTARYCANKNYKPVGNYKTGFLASYALQPTGTRTRSYYKTVETPRTWVVGNQIPPSPYSASRGRFTPETLHDSSKFTCALPDTVKFTNQSLKYRMRTIIYDDNPNLNFNGAGWKDTCKYKNYPYASDSMTYLWRFQDPSGLPCTSNSNTIPDKCNFSTAVAPIHIFAGRNPDLFDPTIFPYNRCQSVVLDVTDAVNNCDDRATFNLRHGTPRASWDKRAFCKMNWDIQRVLSPGSPGPSGPPLRGFLMSAQALQCTGQDFPFRIDFGETLPSCGATRYWITFDSAASTTKFLCPNGIDSGINYGFAGAGNSKGYPVAAPNTVWTGLPWLGRYWYMQGDSGCKTVGIVLDQDGCRDTAWYKDYFCFNKLNAQFDMERQSLQSNTRQFFDKSNLGSFSRICHFSSDSTGSIGVKLNLIASDVNQSGITGFYYGVQRLTLPTKNDYYTRPFWPNKPVLDTALNVVYSSKTDSVTSVVDKYTNASDSSVYFTYRDKNNNLNRLYINNILLTDKNIIDLNSKGNTNVSFKDFRARPYSFSCGDTSLVLYKFRPLTLANDPIYIYRLRDNFKANTRYIPGTDSTIVQGVGEGWFKERKLLQKDTVSFILPQPGVYLVSSGAFNVQGCRDIANIPLYYGHYAVFNIKGGDSIICIGDEVEFEYKVQYWTNACAQYGFPIPLACIDAPIVPNERVSGYSWPLVPFNPWNVKDAVAYRKIDNGNTGWFSTPGFRPETISWNFGDNKAFYSPILGGTTVVKYRFTKPGTFDVTMRTTDSTGCVVNTVRRNLIKVVQPVAGFRTPLPRDTYNICAPKSFTLIDTSKILGSELLDKKSTKADSVRNRHRFGYKDVYKTKQRVYYKTTITNPDGSTFQKDTFYERGIIKDTMIVVDSVVRFIWDQGDGRPAITRTAPDTLFFRYQRNDSFSVTQTIETANTPKSCVNTQFKKDYLVLNGPRPLFTVADTAGCESFSTNAVNLSSPGFLYQFTSTNIATGIKYTDVGKRGDKNVRLKILTPGVWDVVMLQKDSVFDPIEKKFVECSKSYPDTGDKRIRIYVYPKPNFTITGDTFICPNKPANFTITGTGINVYDRYLWSFGDGGTAVTTGLTTTHTYTYSKYPDRFTVSVIAINEEITDTCTNTSSALIRIDSIKANFTIDTLRGSIGIFTFNNESASLPDLGTKYVWEFGDGTSESVNDKRAITHDYTKTFSALLEEEGVEGTFSFKVKLTATSSIGCPDTITKNLQFSRVWQHYNVFTPNGDNINDVFDPRIKGALSYELQIFNRWGERVFFTENKDEDWNGTNKNTGGDCADGVYYYVWNFKLVGNNSTLTKSGTVTLIR
ncbi:MAG: PKD domain-containing protein [Bacteroidota bacterium]|nr:PKD domain-containing protein [Bacteroidota bacterium]